MDGGYNRFMSRSKDAIRDDLFADLNEPQREAVAHTDGPLLILAGPGSGKTRVVTRRAVHLSRTVTDPWRILAITFTNKAAKEMQERIAALGVAEGMGVSTFHALCARLLRQYSDRAGIPRNFTIFDREDRRRIIKKAIAKCDLSTDNYSPARVDRDISQAKNDLLTPNQFLRNGYGWDGPTIGRIYACYEDLLLEMGGLDFDDLLMRIALLLAHDEAFRGELQARYRYILIDEYQDTNAAQYLIAKHLAQEHKNICATGDPDQSIYGWRGANIENILSFEKDYPGAKIVRLEQNYRSTKRILSAADALIAGNVSRKEKTLWTQNEDGPSVCVRECEDARDEAEMIGRDIANQIRSGVDPNDIAIFYRVNSLSRVLEDAMLKRRIVYQIARGLEFYGRKEIKDVLAYLRVLVNPSDSIALLRIINTPPRGIGETTIKRLVAAAEQDGRSVRDQLKGTADLDGLGRSAGKVREFAALLDSLNQAIELAAPDALKHIISHSGIGAMYHQRREVDDEPARNLDELINAAAEFQEEHAGAKIIDWLEHTALVADVDSVRAESGAVTLMTLHAAKGLEFAHVYIVGLEESVLPFQRSDQEYADWEEERRLLFVGITRAKRRLMISHARYRMARGATQRTVRSPFLDELPGDELDWGRVEMTAPRRRPSVSSGELPSDIELWELGTLVRHPEHGLGQIMSLHRGAKRTHADVQFQNGARKSWVLEFADLTRVDFDEVGDGVDLQGV
jgi:DNA helicase-2/ATP-dependent DNA helicase PcrA